MTKLHNGSIKNQILFGGHIESWSNWIGLPNTACELNAHDLWVNFMKLW